MRGRLPAAAFPPQDLLPVILWVGLAAGWGAAAAGTRPTFWTLVNLALTGAFVLPLVVVHEAAHALVGRALGLRVFSVEVGRGPPLVERWVGGIRVTIGRYGLSGQTKMVVPPGTRAGKWRLIASIMAGPAAYALALAAGWIAFGGGGLDGVISTFVTEPSPGSAFMVLSGVMLVLGLLPMAVLSGTQGMSDMAQTLSLLREPEKLLSLHTSMALIIWEATEAFRRGDYTGFHQLIAQGLKEHPGDLSFLMGQATPSGEMTAERWHEAYRSISDLMKNPGWMSPHYFPYVMNAHAYYAVMTRDPTLLPSAESESNLVFGLCPLVPSFVGTRGVVLMHLGQVEEGLKLVRVAYKNAEEGSSCAADAAWMAYGLAKLGKLKEAKKWLRRARRIRPDAPELPIVEAELAPRIPDTAIDVPLPEAPPPPAEPSASTRADTVAESDEDVVVSPLLPGRLYSVHPTTERGEAWFLENADLNRRLSLDEILGRRFVSATLLFYTGEHLAPGGRRPERVRLLIAGGNTEPSPRSWFVPHATLWEILGRMRSKGLKVRESGATVLSVVAQTVVPSGKGSALDGRSGSGAEIGGAIMQLAVRVRE